jgi:hypothetical protein
MKTNTISTSERRRDIVAEIGQVPVIMGGTLTERKRKLSGTRTAVYHQLQRWRGGHNDTRHIPLERLNAVRDGIEGYKKVQALVDEMARLDESVVLATAEDGSKKNSTKA